MGARPEATYIDPDAVVLLALPQAELRVTVAEDDAEMDRLQTNIGASVHPCLAHFVLTTAATTPYLVNCSTALACFRHLHACSMFAKPQPATSMHPHTLPQP